MRKMEVPIPIPRASPSPRRHKRPVDYAWSDAVALDPGSPDRGLRRVRLLRGRAHHHRVPGALELVRHARAAGGRDRARRGRRPGARHGRHHGPPRPLHGSRRRGGVRAARAPLGAPRPREPRRRARRDGVHGARPAQPGGLRGARARSARRPPGPADPGARPRARGHLGQGPQAPRLRALPGRHGRARQLPRPHHHLPRHAAARLRGRPRGAARAGHPHGAPRAGPPPGRRRARGAGARLVMIVMTPEATEAELAAVRAKLETTGVHVLVLPGELTTAICAIGDPEGVRELGLEGMAGVDRVVPISRPYKLASSELAHHEPTVFSVDGHRIGAKDTFALIAGPCTVESREQTLEVARMVAAAGACMLRGGAFKPRTSPFAFKGLGVPGLEILAEARAETGLPVVTELLDAAHAEAVAEHADVVQIGARNMQNYALLEVAGKLGKPVLLKRGLSSSLDELLMAADYVLKEGNPNVILCERGIRTFETATRFTLDLSAIPWLKLHTHLPVIVDPSHASGDRRLVEPMSRGAAAVGADGIIVEVHQDPEVALCDGPQALYARDFAGFAERVAAHAALDGRALA